MKVQKKKFWRTRTRDHMHLEASPDAGRFTGLNNKGPQSPANYIWWGEKSYYLTNTVNCHWARYWAPGHDRPGQFPPCGG